MKQPINPFEDLFNQFFEGIQKGTNPETYTYTSEPAEPNEKTEMTSIVGNKTEGGLYAWSVYYKGILFFTTLNLEDAYTRLEKLIELSEQ